MKTVVYQYQIILCIDGIDLSVKAVVFVLIFVVILNVKCWTMVIEIAGLRYCG